MSEQHTVMQAVLQVNTMIPEARERCMRGIIRILVRRPTEYIIIGYEAQEILDMLLEKISYIHSYREAAVLLAYLLELSDNIASMSEETRKAIILRND